MTPRATAVKQQAGCTTQPQPHRPGNQSGWSAPVSAHRQRHPPPLRPITLGTASGLSITCRKCFASPKLAWEPAQHHIYLESCLFSHETSNNFLLFNIMLNPFVFARLACDQVPAILVRAIAHTFTSLTPPAPLNWTRSQQRCCVDQLPQSLRAWRHQAWAIWTAPGHWRRLEHSLAFWSFAPSPTYLRHRSPPVEEKISQKIPGASGSLTANSCGAAGREGLPRLKGFEGLFKFLSHPHQLFSFGSLLLRDLLHRPKMVFKPSLALSCWPNPGQFGEASWEKEPSGPTTSTKPAQ